jgi:hypothetical protein
MKSAFGSFFAVVLSASLALAAGKSVTGVMVTDVAMGPENATITLTNTSKHDVTGYSIGITQQLANGQEIYSERTEDFGPSAFTHKALRSGETSEQTIVFDQPGGVKSVRADVIVAIYDDQTAEVTNDRTFKDTLATRRKIANALQQSAVVFENAAADAAPRDRAAHDFEALAQNATSNQANVEFLKANAAVAASAPAGEEREFLQNYASQLKQKADAFTRHATIRRLP